MTESGKKNASFLPIAIIGAIVFIVMVVLAISKKSSSDNAPIARDNDYQIHLHEESPLPESIDTAEAVNEPAQTEPVPPEPSEKTAPNEPAATTAPPKPKPPATPSLRQIIVAARTWEPVHYNWIGKAAPDFTLIDIEGNKHKLSDYKGKTVLLIFWATWCPPCRAEIPGLIKLRNAAREDQLVILAASDEKPSTVKNFASKVGINYTVLLDPGNLPSPYGFQRAYRSVGVPCSFFIDPEGKFKLATAGMVSLPETIAILQARN